MADGLTASWRATIASLIVYPLLGPGSVSVLIALPLAIGGLLTLGPGGLLYAFTLGTWWLPALYELLGPPFAVVGIAVALTGRLLGRTSLAAVLAVASLALLAYFTGWYLVTGDIENMVSDAHGHFSDFARNPGSVLYFLGAAAICRWIVRKVSLDWYSPHPARSRSRKDTWAERICALAAAAALAGGLASIPQHPDRAWTDCDEGSWQDMIDGCTRIIGLAEAESVERRVRAHIRRGYSLLDAGEDLDGAIADFTEALRLDPGSAEAHANRGLAHALRGAHRETIEDIDAALTLDPDVFGEAAYRLHRARGLALLASGDAPRAIADHSEEIRLTPRYADGYLQRATAYLANGDEDLAIDDFTDAIRIEEYRADGYVGRGSIFLARGEDDRALADFDEAIRRRPDLRQTAPAYRLRGVVLERQGNSAGALAAYEKALALDPSDAEARTARERLSGS